MSDNLAERVLAIVARQTGRASVKLTPQAELFADLGVDGHDAHDVLLRLREEFGINLEMMRFDRHFGPEIPFSPLALLRPNWWRWHSKRIPVTVETLIEAARTKRWPIRHLVEESA